VQGRVRAVEIIVMEVVREVSSALAARVIRAGIGPLAGDGLDKAFGLAVGLRSIRSGKGVFETQLLTGGSKEF
jgi:hypothetical protein